MACRLIRVFVWEPIADVRGFVEFCRRHGITANPSRDAEVLRTLPEAWTADREGTLFELPMRAIEAQAVLCAAEAPSLQYVLAVSDWPCFVLSRKDTSLDFDQAYAPILKIVPRAKVGQADLIEPKDIEATRRFGQHLSLVRREATANYSR